MEWSTVTDVRDEATPPTKIPMITRPVSVQMMAKIRAGIERGERSPYLSTENKYHHQYQQQQQQTKQTLTAKINRGGRL